MNAATPGPGWRAGGQLLAQPKHPGDKGLAVFFLEHHRLLRRYLIAQGCADSDSDDIVQDAFLIVRQRWATIAYYDKPKAYLYKVAIRLWHRHTARNRPPACKDDHETYLDNVPDPADPYAAIELADTLTRWFGQLPRQQRHVAGLRLIADLSEVETAEVLAVSLGTVKSQLNAARRTLKDLRDREESIRDDKPNRRSRA
jgi:RNA polymerase sigma factor (sigma-70 family)